MDTILWTLLYIAFALALFLIAYRLLARLLHWLDDKGWLIR